MSGVGRCISRTLEYSLQRQQTELLFPKCHDKQSTPGYWLAGHWWGEKRESSQGDLQLAQESSDRVIISATSFCPLLTQLLVLSYNIFHFCHFYSLVEVNQAI